MVLYTIVDINEVMMEGSEQPNTEYRTVNGCVLECSKRSDGNYLERIISTNPKDYLNNLADRKSNIEITTIDTDQHNP